MAQLDRQCAKIIIVLVDGRAGILIYGPKLCPPTITSSQIAGAQQTVILVTRSKRREKNIKIEEKSSWESTCAWIIAVRACAVVFLALLSGKTLFEVRRYIIGSVDFTAFTNDAALLGQMMDRLFSLAHAAVWKLKIIAIVTKCSAARVFKINFLPQ